TAVVKRTHEALAQDGGRSSLHAHANRGEEITSREIFRAAAAGDALAERIVEDTAFYLAVGATNAMHIIDPHMGVFAGGMIPAGESFLQRIQRHVGRLALPVPAAKTRVCFAQLGGNAGFIG